MKRKRKSRAQNKIQGVEADHSLIKTGPAHYSAAPETHVRARAAVVARSTLFNAELEEAIDIIARERVYRAMLSRLKWRLLTPPFTEPMA